MEKVIEINNKGVSHFFNRNFEEAEKEYLKALEIEAGNATTLNNLGLLYHQKKEFEKAEDYFLKALNVNEKAIYRLNLANAQVFLKKWDEAESNYKKSIKQDGENVNAKISLARFYEAQNRFSEATNIWVDMINHSKDDSFEIDLAKNQMALGKYEEALALLSQNKWSGKSAAIYFYIGICEFNLKNYGLAEEAFKKSLGIEPDNFNTRHYLAINYLSKGDYINALKELDLLIRLHPENEKVSLDKVSVLLSLQQIEEAEMLNNKVIRLNNKNAKALQYKKMIDELKLNRSKS